MLDRELYDAVYDEENYKPTLEDEDFYEDEFEDFILDDNEISYNITASPLDVKTFTVEFSYDENVALQLVFDQISNYIEDNNLDFATIHSMYTARDEAGSIVLIVTFDSQGQ